MALQGAVPNVLPTNQDPPTGGFIQPQQQIGQSGLTGTVVAYQGDLLPRVNRQVNILQNRRRPTGISKGQVFQFDLAGLTLGRRLRSVPNGGFGVEKGPVLFDQLGPLVKLGNAPHGEEIQAHGDGIGAVKAGHKIPGADLVAHQHQVAQIHGQYKHKAQHLHAGLLEQIAAGDLAIIFLLTGDHILRRLVVALHQQRRNAVHTHLFGVILQVKQPLEVVCPPMIAGVLHLALHLQVANGLA